MKTVIETFPHDDGKRYIGSVSEDGQVVHTVVRHTEQLAHDAAMSRAPRYFNTPNDLDKIPPGALNNMIESQIENVRWIKSESDARANLASMSTNELMEVWLQWIGIIGYTDSIMNVIDGIKKATLK